MKYHFDSLVSLHNASPSSPSEPSSPFLVFFVSLLNPRQSVRPLLPLCELEHGARSEVNLVGPSDLLVPISRHVTLQHWIVRIALRFRTSRLEDEFFPCYERHHKHFPPRSLILWFKQFDRNWKEITSILLIDEPRTMEPANLHHVLKALLPLQLEVLDAAVWVVHSKLNSVFLQSLRGAFPRLVDELL